MFSCFILGVYYFSVINLRKRKRRYLELEKMKENESDEREGLARNTDSEIIEKYF